MMNDHDDDDYLSSGDEMMKDEDNEEQQQHHISDEQLEIIQQKIAGNAFDYNSHVSLIQAYRQRSSLEELRAARQAMFQVYPLSENLWSQWIQDEMSMIENEQDNTSIQFVKDLFETCLMESIMMSRVWQLYIQFCAQYESEEFTVSILERAVNSIGYHMRVGFTFWEAYRDFVKDDSVLVRSLFHKQLLTPHLQFKSTKRSYIEWESDKQKQVETLNDPAVIEMISSLKRRKKFEKWVKNSPKDGLPSKNSLNHWINYISFEKKQLAEKEQKQQNSQDAFKYTKMFMERAVKECCLSDTLWIEYLKLLESRGEDCINELNPLCYRATRYCPWNSSLWVTYLTFAELSFVSVPERHQELHDQVFTIYSRAMQCGQISKCNDYVQLMSAYCSYMRRRYQLLSSNSSNDENKKQELNKELRSTFEDCVGYIYEYFKDSPDRICILERMWAATEASFLKDVEKAREIFNHITELYGETEATLWLNYAQFEQCHSSDPVIVQQVYHRAYLALDNFRAKKLLANYWLQYEKEYGTIQTLTFAEQLTRDVITHGSIRSEETENEKKVQSSKNNKTEKRQEKGKELKKTNTPTILKPQPEKSGVENQGKVDHVEPQRVVPKPTESQNTIATSFNLELPTPEQLQQSKDEEPTESAPNKNSKKRKRKELEDSETKEDNDHHTRPHKKKKLRGPGNEELTLFILNLNYGTDDYSLRKFFTSHKCNVEDVRIMRDSKGMSKGRAFVEMQDAESVQLGLQLNGEKLNSRVVTVEKSDPNKMKSSPQQHDKKPKQSETTKKPRMKPRVAQIKKASTTTTTTNQQLTNDDFKKLL
jgi:hypothetical protein